jgi:hypothetical protein
MSEKNLKIEKFAIFHNSKFMAALYFLLTIPFGVLFGVIGMIAPSDKSPFPGWLGFIVPFIYAAFGFIFSALGFAIYNWVAGMMNGGIEFTVEEV